LGYRQRILEPDLLGTRNIEKKCHGEAMAIQSIFTGIEFMARAAIIKIKTRRREQRYLNPTFKRKSPKGQTNGI
jgi:hypothetical protein